MRRAITITFGSALFFFGAYFFFRIGVYPEETPATVGWVGLGCIAMGGLVLLDDVILPVWDRLTGRQRSSRRQPD